MSDNHDPRARLVAEAFNDNWETGPASAFARAAAAAARRRRVVRSTLLVTATMAVAFLTVLTFAWRRTAPGHPPEIPFASPMLASRVSPAFEIISDDELFAALRTRPLLILPNEPADRRYVVLAPAFQR